MEFSCAPSGEIGELNGSDLGSRPPPGHSFVGPVGDVWGGEAFRLRKEILLDRRVSSRSLMVRM